MLPTTDTISAAANSVVATTPADERISFIFAPGATSYPIANYEYAVVNTTQPSGAVASAIQGFLTWAINQGNSATYLNQVHFLPLPAPIKALSAAQIAQIQ